MKNKEYFDWLYKRLIYVYNENPNVDFVQSFKKRTDWLIQNIALTAEDVSCIIHLADQFGKDYQKIANVFNKDREEEGR